ncbi:MAG: EAL domain-containing protein [Burkholderiales bacterium]|nr:EAL domain-containing protein [Burkholderiales bacterium]
MSFQSIASGPDAPAARASWLDRMPIALRLAAAFALLLALLGGVVLLALDQADTVGRASRELAETGIRQVTLARRAQHEAAKGAGHLYSLFLLRDRAARVPVYATIDQSTRDRNAALTELLAATRQPGVDPPSPELIRRLLHARDCFTSAFDRTVETIELDLAQAEPVMVNETRPALAEMLATLDELVAHNANQASAALAGIAAVGQASRERMTALGVLAVLAALASAVLITRAIAQPLADAVRLAGDVSAGRMNTALPRTRSPEVGALVRALDQMRSSLVEREARIAELAYRDPLSGLANRTLFNDRLAQTVAAARRTGVPLAVLVIDLDRFKDVNDVLGHPVGDRLLAMVAVRMEQVLQRGSDTLARTGGDEFAVLLPTQGRDAGLAVARKLNQALDEPLSVDGQTVDLGGSIGIACFPDDGDSATQLLACADIAMYTAKQARTGYASFTPSMARTGRDGLGMLSDLRRAVENNEFVLQYQPKVSLSDLRCRSAEALVRWNHPERGWVRPDQFIPFAEQTGFIKSITRWVLANALAQLARWRADGLDIALNVNISTRDLVHQDLPALVAEGLQAHGLPADALTLEVTEGAIMEDAPRALAALAALHAMGVRLSIDDFGTGHSSLAYLARLPVHELKIDRSFMHNLDRNPANEAIVRTTLELAHQLRLSVVAEGVETEAVVERLAALGCDVVQGYFFSRPLDAAAFEAWCQQRGAARHCAVATVDLLIGA